MKPFSERIGAVETPTELLVDRVSPELWISLWNLLHSLYYEYTHKYWVPISRYVARYFRKVPVDDLPYDNVDCMEWFKEYFFVSVGRNPPRQVRQVGTEELALETSS